MATHRVPEPGGRHRAPDGSLPTEAEMISTTEAATILDKSSRTVIRWVDRHYLRGDRARDPATGQPLPWSPRWVDARHAVELAVAAGRGHLVPQRWRYLIPGSADAETPAASDR